MSIVKSSTRNPRREQKRLEMEKEVEAARKQAEKLKPGFFRRLWNKITRRS